MIKIKTLFVILFFLNFITLSSADIFIAYKVNQEIITNVDIEIEKNYLLSLNNQLRDLDDDKIKEIAIKSIIKEKIKKIELSKYYKLDQKNQSLEAIIKQFYVKLGLKNEIEFNQYLKPFNMTTNKIKKKIEIETTWNQLIYDKYNNQISIDMESLKKSIDQKKLTNNVRKYQLSEIVFEKDKDETFEEKILKIQKSINDIGFKNTANTFSVTDSSKFGGSIGWVEEANLSKKIKKSLTNLTIGNITQPISIGKNFLILKLENIKIEKNIVDKKKELAKNIQFERNRQLELFSKIYFDKIKINTYISEL